MQSEVVLTLFPHLPPWTDYPAGLFLLGIFSSHIWSSAPANMTEAVREQALGYGFPPSLLDEIERATAGEY